MTFSSNKQMTKQMTVIVFGIIRVNVVHLCDNEFNELPVIDFYILSALNYGEFVILVLLQSKNNP